MPRKQSLRQTKKKSRFLRKKRTTRTRTARNRNKRRHMKGGNYETDVTTRTYMGIPTKPLNKITATIPGFPVMSGASFYKHQEYEDFHGKDDYD